MPEVGIYVPTPAADVQQDTVVAFGQRAEAAGVHSLWTLDRLVFDNQESLLCLAALAATTRRVKLGTSVLLGTLRPPALLAKMVATLDVLSGGRVILGLGAGSRPDDFAAAEVPFEHRGSRLTEAMEVLRLAWSGVPLTHDGPYHHMNVGPIGPKPVQAGGPPIWLGGSADSALRRVGRLADGYVGTSSGGPDGLRVAWAKVQQAAEQAGRDPSSLKLAALVYACVDDDRDRAVERAGAYLRRYYPPARAQVPPWFLLGPPETCIETAHTYFAAGVDVLIVGPVTADLGHLDRLLGEVVGPLQR
jgi:probable F420-dependent oxidoreductase